MLSRLRWASAGAAALLLAGCARAPIEAGVRHEEVRFQSGDASLAGTLFLPDTRGRHPAVVLFHGSGPAARNAAVADWFAGWGIAALAYDKRGVGESTGDFRTVAFPALVEDGLAAIALLKTRRDIDAHQIGVWGLSQGGWLGPLAASKSSDVAFVIAVSGPAVSPGEQMIFFWASRLRAKGYSAAEVDQASALRRAVWRYLSTGSGYEEARALVKKAASQPWIGDVRAQGDDLLSVFEHPETARSDEWYRAEVNYDPLPALRSLKVPALFLFGGSDEDVPVSKSVELIRATLTASGHRDFEIKVFPGADHQLHLRAPSGSIRLAPGYTDTMKTWVLKHVRLP